MSEPRYESPRPRSEGGVWGSYVGYLHEMEYLLRRYQDALLRIANEDYRGPEPSSVRQARQALIPPGQKADS